MRFSCGAALLCFLFISSYDLPGAHWSQAPCAGARPNAGAGAQTFTAKGGGEGGQPGVGTTRTGGSGGGG